jgi:regulator of protease activity HflC (stomatin/prohibitin superfamily)
MFYHIMVFHIYAILQRMTTLFVLLSIAFVILIVLSASLFTVSQQSAAIIERFGKFVRIANAGLNIKIPFIEHICGHVGLRLTQIDVEVETKTYDNVFLKVTVSVQYRVLSQRVYEAFYTLDNAVGQIQAFIFDVVRARVPKIKLDDVFAKKDEIADSVQGELKEVMNAFGYDIIKALVTDIIPDAKVKSAMNEINEAQRLRIAANERGEAEKILKIKQAEGDAESKILQGKGLAGERKAIIEGLKDSLSDFQHNIHDVNTREVMSLILMTQYFDTLKTMGTHGKMNTILLPHSPSGLNEIYDQIRTAMISANQVEK